MARVLVVEDVKFISKILAEIFENEGHEVIVAPDGLEALAVARNQSPDLVLTDIAMPGMDGLDLCRTLKEDAAVRHIPVMIVSSRNDQKTIQQAHEAGVDEYLTKPFETEELLEKAGTLLGGFRMHFSIDVEKDIPVVAVLKHELVADTASELREALETARGGGGRPMILDLSRVTKVHPEISDAVLEFSQVLKAAGGQLELVKPDHALGIRALVIATQDFVGAHDTLDDAVRSARRAYTGKAGTSSRIITEVLGDTDHFSFPVETVTTAAFQEIAEAIETSSSPNVCVDLSEVRRISSEVVGHLKKLSTEFSENNRNLRVSGASPEVVAQFTARGLADLLSSGSPT